MNFYNSCIKNTVIVALTMAGLVACAPLDKSDHIFEPKVVYSANNVAVQPEDTVIEEKKRLSRPVASPNVGDTTEGHALMKENLIKRMAQEPSDAIYDISGFSNENVTVYSLYKPISSLVKRAKYDKKKTTDYPGGHVVFDQSVTVYSVDKNLLKPNFMPNYSVPTYGISPENRLTPMPIDTVASISNPEPGPIMLKPSNVLPLKPTQRRAPSLTVYD